MKKPSEKKELKKETKKRILKNAGKAIEKFMGIKNMTVLVLSKKTGIKISDVNDICSGRKTPTKEQVKLCCKALDIPKEIILLYSIEENDVAPRKRQLFNDLLPSLKGLIESVVKDDPKQLSKKQVVDKSVKLLTAHKKFKINKPKKDKVKLKKVKHKKGKTQTTSHRKF